MKTEHFDFLKNNRACDEGLKWAETQSGLYELWNNCHRGDWLSWLANRLQVDERKRMMCGALCAHSVIHLMTDRRSREAVRIAFLYARGKATDKQLKEAKCAAVAAAKAARDAACIAAWAAYIATCVGATSAAKAAADAAREARQANELRTAEIARKILTQDVFAKISKL